MRIKVEQNNNGSWRVTPQAGCFAGRHIANADGISLEHVVVEGTTIYGDLRAVWGLEVIDDLAYNDGATIKGLRIGQSFDMRGQHSVEEYGGTYVLSETGARIESATSMWILNNDIQSYGETLASSQVRRMAGGVAVHQ